MASSPSTVPEIDPAGVGAVLALVAGACGLFERRPLTARAIGGRTDRADDTCELS